MSDEKKSGVFKWIACGCGGCLLGIVAIIVAVAGLGGLAYFGLMKNDAYLEAVERATTNPAVIDVLGEPIEPATFFSGSVNVDDTGGTADLAVPLSGPKGDGVLYVKATKHGDTWEFSQMEVSIEGSDESIDLLAPAGMLERVD